jgi:hypothetical protein
VRRVHDERPVQRGTLLRSFGGLRAVPHEHELRRRRPGLQCQPPVRPRVHHQYAVHLADALLQHDLDDLRAMRVQHQLQRRRRRADPVLLHDHGHLRGVLDEQRVSDQPAYLQPDVARLLLTSTIRRERAQARNYVTLSPPSSTTSMLEAPCYAPGPLISSVDPVQVLVDTLKEPKANWPEQRQEEEPSSGRRAWLPEFPSVSGDLCAQALIQLGWMPLAWSQRICSLARDGENIFVPRERMLHHERVDELLRKAGVFPLEFIEALERVCNGDIEDISGRSKSSRRPPR